MFLLRKPGTERINAFLERQCDLPFSYDEQGATFGEPPADYQVDHTRVLLGKGEGDFRSAKEALRRWEQFDIDWLQLCWPDKPICERQIVGILTRAWGMWCLNACRVLRTVDADDPPRFGFAYGTLPRHVARGEERFLVEMSPDTGEVWYDIFAFSKPAHVLTRLFYFQMRRLQRRFARSSTARMIDAVRTSERLSSLSR